MVIAHIWSRSVTIVSLQEEDIRYRYVCLLIQVIHLGENAIQCLFCALKCNIEMEHPTAFWKNHLKFSP